MKSSACCITRSSSARLFIGLLAFSALPASVTGQSGDTPKQGGGFPVFADVLKANSLQEKGRPPFDLKLSFQIIGLDGKPGEQGTVEEWWAGPLGNYVEISAPSFGTAHHPGLTSLPNNNARRSLFLANTLLEQVRSPGAELAGRRADLITDPVMNGSVALTCFSVNAGVTPPRRLCAQADETIRLISDAEHQVARNSLGTFAGTHVALDTKITYGSRPVITGHVVS